MKLGLGVSGSHTGSFRGSSTAGDILCNFAGPYIGTDLLTRGYTTRKHHCRNPEQLPNSCDLTPEEKLPKRISEPSA